MSERVRAEREKNFQEHAQVTDAMIALAGAARKAHDTAALEFARRQPPLHCPTSN
jgi:hypothetical protein